eukprot:7450394-Karenia_brevis.AAC.1
MVKVQGSRTLSGLPEAVAQEARNMQRKIKAAKERFGRAQKAGRAEAISECQRELEVIEARRK